MRQETNSEAVRQVTVRQVTGTVMKITVRLMTDGLRQMTNCVAGDCEAADRDCD